MEFVVIKAAGKRKQMTTKIEMEKYTPVANDVVGSTILDEDIVSTTEEDAGLTGTRNETSRPPIGNTNNDFQHFFDLIFEDDIPLQILCPPWKPFHAVVKGMGGGKTRGLEEIRRELLLEEGVLPIAITFNSHWEVSDQFDSWRDIVGNDDVA
eukprot:gene12482-26273_t